MESWITDTMGSMGYAGVVWLTFLENVFPPIPSELILPLAGYLAAQGRLSLAGAIVAATVGTVLGALALYALGAWYGEERLQRLVARHGRWVGISPRELARVWAWFDRHGTFAVFVCRMVPGLRALISIPAGVHRMDLGRFLLATTAGTLVWTGALITFGHLAGRHFERIGDYIGPVSNVVLGALLVAYLVRVLRYRADADTPAN